MAGNSIKYKRIFSSGGEDGSGSGVQSVNSGTGINVDNTDPQNPIINSTITQYTDEMAQDSVGSILTDSSTVDFTYNDAVPSITATVIDDSITNSKLANMSTQTIKGRTTAGSGDPEDLSSTDVRSIIGYQGYTMYGQFCSSVQSPADASTYYGGSNFGQALNSTAALQRIYPPKAGTIKTAIVQFRQGVVGTAEQSTVSIRLNNTTDTTISAVVTNDSNFTVFLNTSLNIAVNGTTDYIEFKWVTPTWVTNPTGFIGSVAIYIE